MNVRNNFLKKPIPIIFGVKSYKLKKKEKSFFRKSNPLGFILFERNCKNYNQTKLLIRDLKKTTSHKYTMIMIDQEGGRVARLKNPNWKSYPSAEYFGIKAKKNLSVAKKLIFKNSIEIAKDLKKLGINMNCAPVLDVKYDFTNNVIGDRSFSSNPRIVSELGKSFCNGLKKIGIIPIVKHIPGHGPSSRDSHKTTPNVDLDLISLNKKDFLPFKKSSFDSIVSSLVLCSIDDVEKTFNELNRVLKSKGKYFFWEHTIINNKIIYIIKNIFIFIWKFFTGGCNYNIDNIFNINSIKWGKLKIYKKHSRLVKFLGLYYIYGEIYKY